MVLGGAMKIIVFLSSSAISGVICFIAFSLLSKHQLDQIGYTPLQSDQLIDLFMVVAPLFIVAGGWLSLWLYKKHLTNKDRS